MSDEERAGRQAALQTITNSVMDSIDSVVQRFNNPYKRCWTHLQHKNEAKTRSRRLMLLHNLLPVQEERYRQHH